MYLWMLFRMRLNFWLTFLRPTICHRPNQALSVRYISLFSWTVCVDWWNSCFTEPLSDPWRNPLQCHGNAWIILLTLFDPTDLIAWENKTYLTYRANCSKLTTLQCCSVVNLKMSLRNQKGLDNSMVTCPVVTSVSSHFSLRSMGKGNPLSPITREK